MSGSKNKPFFPIEIVIFVAGFPYTIFGNGEIPLELIRMVAEDFKFNPDLVVSFFCAKDALKSIKINKNMHETLLNTFHY
jgi:hypothetical protein